MSTTPKIWPSDGIVETLSYKTNVIEAHNGNENRHMCRVYPRQEFKCKHMGKTAAATQEFFNQLTANRAGTWNVPLYPEFVTASAVPAVGATSVSVFTTNMSLEAGDSVLLWQSAGLYEVLASNAVASGSISLEEAVSVTFIEEQSLYVCPVFSGVLATDPEYVAKPGQQPVVTATWLIVWGRDLDNAGSWDTYNSLPVLHAPSKFYSGNGQSGTVYMSISSVDYDTGVVWQESKNGFLQLQPELSFIENYQDGARELWRFLVNCRGKQQAFWHPLWHDPMTIAADIGSTDTTIYVDNNQHTLVSGHETRGYLYVQTTGGTRYYRAISGIVASSGQAVITIDSALGADISMGEVHFVGWLGKYRLNTDEIELTWATAPALEASVKAQEVVQ